MFIKVFGYNVEGILQAIHGIILMPRIMAYPKSMLPTLWFMCCMVVNCCKAILGGIKYILWVSISCNRGQRGKFIMPWKMGVASPKFGLAQRVG